MSQIGDEAISQAETAMSVMKDRHREYQRRIAELRARRIAEREAGMLARRASA
jgi:hypothetical protein